MAWQAPGRATASAFIVVEGVERAIAFAETVFGATALRPPLLKSDGTVWNAEISIGDSTVMLGEAQNGFSRPGFVYVYVEDVDTTYAAALAAGGQAMMAVEDQFYGDRAGGITDPCGNIWWIATHQRALSDDELEAAARKAEAGRRG